MRIGVYLFDEGAYIMSGFKTRRSLFMVALAVTVAPTVSYAQSSAETIVEDDAAATGEIYVTARKVGERLQDVPLAITAFTEEALEKRDIGDMQELAKASPGIAFNQGPDRSYGAVTFRGMRNNSIADPTRENSSLFIDGIYYISVPAAMNFDDIERVEVVKGPQSAFFGRSTFGGAINFITHTPGDDLHATGFMRAATYDHYEMRAAVEGGIVPGLLAARIAGRYETFGGMYENAATGGRLGEQETKSVSGTVLFTPFDGFSMRGRAAFVKQDDGPPAAQLIGRYPDHNCFKGGTNFNTSIPGGAGLYCGKLEFNGTPSIAPIPEAARSKVPEEGNHRKFTELSLISSYEFPSGWSIDSLTGRQIEKLDNVDNYTHSAEMAYGFYTRRRSSSFSEELRLATPQDARLRALAGVYYIRQKFYSNQQYIIGEDNVVAAFFGGVGAVTAGAPTSKVLTNKAVFGSLAFDITDQLTVSGEARYQNDKVRNAAGGAGSEFSTNAFLPRVIVDYKVAPDVMVYASYAKGNKPTQANSLVVPLSAERQAIAAQNGLLLVAKEEIIHNYEVGFKSRFLDNRLTFNAAVFYADWKGKQTSGTVNIDFNEDGFIDPTLTGANREYFYGSIIPQGDETVFGFELDTSFAATEQLTLSGSFAYTKPDFKSPTTSIAYFAFYGLEDASGQDESGISKYQASLSSEYRAPVSDTVDGFMRADLNYASSRWASILNVAYTGDSYLLNLKAGIETGPFTITAYVDNVLQDDTVISATQTGDAFYDQLSFRVAAFEVALPRKRQFGLTVAARY